MLVMVSGTKASRPAASHLQLSAMTCEVLRRRFGSVLLGHDMSATLNSPLAP